MYALQNLMIQIFRAEIPQYRVMLPLHFLK